MTASFDFTNDTTSEKFLFTLHIVFLAVDVNFQYFFQILQVKVVLKVVKMWFWHMKIF